MNFHQNLKQETCTSFLYKFLERMSLRVQVYSIIRMFYTGSIYTWCVSSPEPYRVVRWPYTLCRISRALTSVFGCTEIDYGTCWRKWQRVIVKLLSFHCCLLSLQ